MKKLTLLIILITSIVKAQTFDFGCDTILFAGYWIPQSSESGGTVTSNYMDMDCPNYAFVINEDGTGNTGIAFIINETTGICEEQPNDIKSRVFTWIEENGVFTRTNQYYNEVIVENISLSDDNNVLTLSVGFDNTLYLRKDTPAPETWSEVAGIWRMLGIISTYIINPAPYPFTGFIAKIATQDTNNSSDNYIGKTEEEVHTAIRNDIEN